MGFLKKIADALTGGSGSSDKGIYAYIKIKRSGEIVRLRLNPGNEISRNDEGQLFTRKLVMGLKSFDKVETILYFDDRYNITSADISGGELSNEAAYQAQEHAIA